MMGFCTCREVIFEMTAAPLFVHCCHCRWCQRETGAAFALNAVIEADAVALLTGAPQVVDTPSESGRGQKITRCSKCMVALWSVYPGLGSKFLFIRVGVLQNPDEFPPDIHIFTESKQPWVVIPDGAPAMAKYYRREDHWPAASLERRRAAMLAD
jgi:hypothetical protein